MSDSAQTLGGWTPDGSAIIFSGRQQPTLHRAPRLFIAPVAGGPVRLLSGVHGGLPRAFPSRHASTLITFTRGPSSGMLDQVRPGYTGSAQSDLWLLNVDLAQPDPEPVFTRLTTSPFHDGEGFLTPDSSVVFLSSRDGQYNVWRIPGAGNAPAAESSTPAQQLTRFAPAQDEVTIGHGVRDLAVAADGSRAAFVVWNKLYTLDLTRSGAQPVAVNVLMSTDVLDGPTRRVDLDREVSEAALSPDGETLAVIARGEVFVRGTGEGRPTRRVTGTVGRERDLAWSPDGKLLFFSSDEGGEESISSAQVVLAREDLKPDDEGTSDEEGKPADEPAEPAEPAKADPTEPAQPTEGAQAAPEPPAAAQPEPGADKPESDVKPDDDKAKAPSEPDWGKRWSTALTFQVDPVAGTCDNGAHERRPLPSPDGARLLLQRGLGELVLVNLADGSAVTLLTGFDPPDARWGPDSRHVVYSREDLNFNSDVWLMNVDAQSGEPLAPPGVNLTRHPDNDLAPRLSADGKTLVFLSDRGGENGQYDIWTLALDRELEAMRPYETDAHVKKAGEAAKKRKPFGKDKDAKPVQYTPFVDDAHLRVRRLVAPTQSAGELVIAPGADRIVFSTTDDGKRVLVSVNHKGEDRKTIDTAEASSVGVSLTGERVAYVKSGQAALGNISGGKVETLAISAPVVVDIAAQNAQKFREASRIIGSRFYHPTMKGVDWDALTRRYQALAQRARTSDEFNRVGNMLFGQLEASHLGMSGGPNTAGFSATPPKVGYLGIDVSPVGAGYRVDRVIPGGPGDRATPPLVAGDVITHVNAVPFVQPGDVLADLSASLAGTAQVETLLTLQRGDDPGGPARVALIVPSSLSQEADLRYDDTVRARRALAERLSEGAVGYLHIRGMSLPSVRDFERDLFAAGEGKQALIIDVRDNGGGFTADILLSSLTAPRHAYTIPRGGSEQPGSGVPTDVYPRDRRLIYAWTRPITVLMNQNSFSNAEIFSHAIKTIQRGRLVGTPTYGGVISTGSATLIDGTTIRVPFRGWYLPNGTDMENNGAQPDIPVEQTPADEAEGRDPQLEAAVRALIEDLR